MWTITQTASAAESAQALADAAAADLRAALAAQERAVLAVSGGKSPIAFFQALNQADLDWARVDITLADERLVPTKHADSNTALVRTHLLQNRAAAAQWRPLVDDAADEGSLKNTDAAVQFALAHFRRPDVLVLGMGNDGHTASIFPQSPQYADAVNPDYPQPLLHTSPVTAPHERISLTLAAILATPRLYLAIAGAEKRQVFKQAAEAVSPTFPVSHILHDTKSHVHVFYHN